MQKLGWFGGLASPKIISNITIRQSAYDFLFDFNRNCAHILYRFRVIVYVFHQKWAIITTTSICRRCRGQFSSNYVSDLWRQKTTFMGLSCGIICVILHLAELIRYECDRHTDRHTRRRRTVYTALQHKRRTVKVDKLRYFSNNCTDLDEILHADAYWLYEP